MKSSSLLLATCLSAALLLGAEAYVQPYPDRWYHETLKEINEYRASYGLPNLCMSKKMNLAAQEPIERQAATGESPSPKTFIRNLNQYGFNYNRTLNHVLCISDWRDQSEEPVGRPLCSSLWPEILNPCPTHMGLGKAEDPKSPGRWCFYLALATNPNPNQDCDYRFDIPIRKISDFKQDKLRVIENHGNHLFGGSRVILSEGKPICAPLPPMSPSSPPNIHTPKNVPTPPPQRVPTPPPLSPTTPDLPTSRRLTAKDLFDGPSNQTATSKDPNPIQTALSTYNNNTTVGVQSAFDQLKLTLSSPYLILFLGTVLAATTLVWYFRGAIYGFFKGIYDSALSWFSGKSKKVQKAEPSLSPGPALSLKSPPIEPIHEGPDHSHPPPTPQRREPEKSSTPVSPRKTLPPKNLEELGKLILDPVAGKNVKLRITTFNFLGWCQKDPKDDLKTIPEMQKLLDTIDGWREVCYYCKDRSRKNLYKVCETLKLQKGKFY